LRGGKKRLIRKHWAGVGRGLGNATMYWGEAQKASVWAA
jgi:hypothetical protein